jgi:hypothetical protein
MDYPLKNAHPSLSYYETNIAKISYDEIRKPLFFNEIGL